MKTYSLEKIVKIFNQHNRGILYIKYSDTLEIPIYCGKIILEDTYNDLRLNCISNNTLVSSIKIKNIDYLEDTITLKLKEI